jgi:hypothetical protein
MTRIEFVRRFVLIEIADDYEDLEHIYSLVARDSLRSGLTVQKPEIIHALVELIEAGLATAYRLSGSSPAQKIQGVPPRAEIEDSYIHFWATPKGRELVVSDRDWWPFDDEGALRRDWSPPNA